MKKRAELGPVVPEPLKDPLAAVPETAAETAVSSAPGAQGVRAVLADPIAEDAAAATTAAFSDADDEAATSDSSTPVEAPGILEEMAEKQSRTQEKSLSAYENNRRRIHEQKKRRLVSRLKRALLLFTLLLSCGLLLYYLPLFHVQSFQIEGAKHMTEREVINVSAVNGGDHLLKGWGGGLAEIFALRNGGAEKRIKAAFPYVDSVRVNAKLPGIVHIAVTERVPVSYLDYQGSCVLLDKDGIVLEIKAGGAPAGIPIILNAKLSDPIPGETVSDETKRSIRPAMLVLDAVVSSDSNLNDGFSLFHQIQSIRLSEGPETFLSFGPELATPGSEVKLGGRQTLEDAVNWLRYALRTEVIKAQGKGTFDLTGTRKFFYPDKNQN